MSDEAPFRAFEKAVEIAGSQTAFATVTGSSQQLISYLLKNQRPLSPKYVLKAEAAFGVSRHELRPDIYPLDTTVTGFLPLSHDGGDVANGAPIVAFNRSAVLPFEAGND